MRIVGEWLRCDDGITRPTIRAIVIDTDGKVHNEVFYVDTGADCTAFSAALLTKLSWPTNGETSSYSLRGIGGSTGFVEGTATVELTRDDGGPARISGPFRAFIDPAVTDLSILGRDVLHHFDVIVSRRRNEVLLLAGNHQYHVAAT